MYGPKAKVLVETIFKKGCGWKIGGSWVEHGWTTSGVHIHVDHIWNKGGAYKMILLPPSSTNLGIVIY